jgi:hypothetical protein
MMDTCSACGARMIWAVTPAGARSPIDYEPSEQGNVLLTSPEGLGQTLAVVLSKGGLGLARSRGMQLRTSHFVTCPDRERFKR